MANPQKNILITGYYGFQNTGDEAILRSIIDQFRATRKDLTFTVISGDPSHTSIDHDVDSVHWKDISAISTAINKSDLVVIGGGGLFQDYWGFAREQLLTSGHHSLSYYGGIPVLAKLHQKPLVLYSLGVGPINSPEAKKFTRFITEQASLVSVRDRGSKSLLESLGVKPEIIHLVPDPAFVFEPSLKIAKTIFEQFKIKDISGPILGVCLRNWNIGISSNQWQKEIAHALDAFITSSQVQVLFIPFQSMPSDSLQDDIAFANQVLRKMEKSHNARVIPDMYPADVIYGFIKHCDLILGMRLHSLIFAIQSGIPVVGLSYDDKINNLMADFGLQDYLLHLASFSGQELETALQRAYGNKLQLGESLLAQTQSTKKTLSDFTQTALRLLDSKPQPETISDFDQFMREFSLDKIDQLALLEARDQSKILEEIRSSFAWQVVKLYWNIRQRLIPRGSLAEKPLNALKKVIRIWQELGTRVFLQTAWHRILEPFLDIAEKILPKSNNWEKNLSLILERHANAKGVVVILPNIKWSVSLFQRPQQIALAFARLGYLVFYLELARPRQNKGMLEIHERVYRSPIPAQTVEHRYAVPLPHDVFKEIDSPITIAYTYNKQFLPLLENPRVVYEYIDELDVFPYEKKFIQQNHREFLLSADVVVATAKRLHEEVLKERTDAILCPNGVDYDHFQQARGERTTHPPSDLKKVIKAGHPVIGYYGALARWFDFDLLKEAARQRPDWSFILIGTDYDNSLHPSGILKAPNIHWLGPRPYSDLPGYLVHFDVATIPFKINDITHSTSPLKMFEYFAGHKPVVATAMHEVQRYDGVLIANNVQEFIEQVERALALKDDLEFVAKLDRIARENTWEARVEQIIHSIE